MNVCRVLSLVAIPVLLLAAAWGCSDVTQLTDPNPAYETLVVAYGNPGPSGDPCDDALPMIDGVAQDLEWSSAQPHYARVTGRNGNGGRDFYVEVRAVWTDEAKVGGTNTIYFLVRYEDDDFNSEADVLGYVKEAGPLERCDTDDVTIEGKRYCQSPPPLFDVPGASSRFDDILLDPEAWTRLNPDGKEDQVVMLITQVSGPESDSKLIDLNSELMGIIGPEIPQGGVTVTTVAENQNTDVWVWRAGRTNLHPIPQYPDWTNRLADEVPLPSDSRYGNKSGYCEDAWIGMNSLIDDDGPLPFTKNFDRIDQILGPLPDVPVRLTQCPSTAREPTEEELAGLNGGVAKDLGLWWQTSKPFSTRDTLACSRIGTPRKWSTRLLPGEYDKVRGWALQNPYDIQNEVQTSSGDVRARGTYEATQDKGFGVHTLEIMRDLNTMRSDDLPIDPTDTTREYRIVIGIMDNSGKVGSGSTEIRLKFEAPKAATGGPVNRC